MLYPAHPCVVRVLLPPSLSDIVQNALDRRLPGERHRHTLHFDPQRRAIDAPYLQLDGRHLATLLEDLAHASDEWLTIGVRSEAEHRTTDEVWRRFGSDEPHAGIVDEQQRVVAMDEHRFW